MKFKGYLLWFFLAVICYLFILYGWIKEIEWMIPTFWIASVIFATIAATIEFDNIKVINNLWDDLDSLKQKVSKLDDTITNLKEKDKQEDYWVDKYPR